MMNLPFWKTKALHEMTSKEWESLCSKCGICCLHRLDGKNLNEAWFTQIACRNLDLETCLCTVYVNRFKIDPGCKKMTPDNVLQLKWLPESCGYRTVAEKRNLDWWHPLISGSSETVHQAGISLKNKRIISADNLAAGDVLKNLLISPKKIF